MGAALALWHLLPVPFAGRGIAAVGAIVLVLFLVQLRFLPQMTVALWTRLWGGLAPLLLSSLLTLSILPTIPLLFFLTLVILLIGIWAAYRFYPLMSDTRLHTARFAKIDEMETLLSSQPVPDGLILGTVRQFYVLSHYVCIRPTKTKKEIGHSLIVAPSGRGKTTMNEGQILALDTSSLIITDPKGELFADTAGYRARVGPVFVVDPTRGVGHCFDPLQESSTEDEYQTMAKILVFEPHTTDPYWINSAARLIEVLFQAARREAVSPLPYVRHLLRLGLPAVASRLNELDPPLATAFLGKDFAQAHLETDRTLFGIWSTLQTQLAPLLTETLIRVFVRSDFTAETFLRKERPATLYLRLQEGHLKRLSPFVRLMVESLVKDMIATWEETQGQGCRGVFFDLEEAGIAPLPNLDEYVATGRSKGFVFQLFYQSISQIEDNYGRDKARSIMENMDTRVFLKPNHIQTAHEIEDWLGKGSQYSESFHFREGSEYSEGRSEQPVSVMSARQIMELQENQALVFHGNYKPMKVQRLKWWQSPLLSARHGLPVPRLAPLPMIPDLPHRGDRRVNADGATEVFSPPVAYVNPDAIPRIRPWREQEKAPER
jgi:type IV secretion system protein VirD4